MVQIEKKIERTEREKYRDKNNNLVFEYKIISSGKLFELGMIEEFLFFKKDIFFTEVERKYRNSKFFISVDSMNKKIKSKSLFDTKRDNWYNLRNDYDFELTINKLLNGFNLKEYIKNEDDEKSTDQRVMNRIRSTSRFGLGDENEGIFFTYDCYFCLLGDGTIIRGTVDHFSNPKNKFEKFIFRNPEIISIVEDLISIGFSQYIDWENSVLQKVNENELELLRLMDKVLVKFDKDGNGLIDVIEDKDEFEKLLTKHQNLVIEKGKEFNQNYVHQFIKVNNYLKDKKINLQLMFDSIRRVDTPSELSQYVEFIEDEIHSYNLLLFNSLNLIVSLIENDQITFYNIYEKFDKLNIFSSNWEKEVSLKLSQVNFNLNLLFHQINDMTNKIVNSINELTYVTEQSNRMVENRLMEIDSTIKTNNLLTLINTYQTYKVNKNTKSLRS